MCERVCVSVVSVCVCVCVCVSTNADKCTNMDEAVSIKLLGMARKQPTLLMFLEPCEVVWTYSIPTMPNAYQL